MERPGRRTGRWSSLPRAEPGAVCDSAGVGPGSAAAHVAEVLASLSRREAYPHPVDDVTVVQTHVSMVFLAGPFAYKVKKPVHFEFLDAHLLERRAEMCAEEVLLNRRLAPAL